MSTSEWTVVVADDEPAARRGVRQLLAAYPEFAVVRECRDGREVLEALDAVTPDVLFLDIQMPEIDGFEVVRRRTAERMPATVFLTAFDQFALRAFEAAAHDYLVKPVSEERFAAAMRRLRTRLHAGGAAAREPAIVVDSGHGTLVLSVREIDWIESADNYARIWVGGRSYLLREPLAELERRVAAYGFARAHRSALVRVDGVRALKRMADGDMVAVLASGARVPISRRRRAAFVASVRAGANAPFPPGV